MNFDVLHLSEPMLFNVFNAFMLMLSTISQHSVWFHCWKLDYNSSVFLFQILQISYDGQVIVSEDQKWSVREQIKQRLLRSLLALPKAMIGRSLGRLRNSHIRSKSTKFWSKSTQMFVSNRRPWRSSILSATTCLRGLLPRLRNWPRWEERSPSLLWMFRPPSSFSFLVI